MTDRLTFQSHGVNVSIEDEGRRARREKGIRGGIVLSRCIKVNEEVFIRFCNSKSSSNLPSQISVGVTTVQPEQHVLSDILDPMKHNPDTGYYWQLFSINQFFDDIILRFFVSEKGILQFKLGDSKLGTAIHDIPLEKELRVIIDLHARFRAVEFIDSQYAENNTTKKLSASGYRKSISDYPKDNFVYSEYPGDEQESVSQNVSINSRQSVTSCNEQEPYEENISPKSLELESYH